MEFLFVLSFFGFIVFTIIAIYAVVGQEKELEIIGIFIAIMCAIIMFFSSTVVIKSNKYDKAVSLMLPYVEVYTNEELDELTHIEYESIIKNNKIVTNNNEIIYIKKAVNNEK